MTITEVFPNPTVKKVIFQIRFPNLFFLESRMGDIQVKIMKEFPESELIIRRNLLLTEVDQGSPVEAGVQPEMEETARKIWRFSSGKGVILKIHQSSLSISSSAHKTYNNPEGEPRFRDAISAVLVPFLAITGLPVVQRIGLRYIDECPVPNRETQMFNEYYNSCFPLKRFPLEDCLGMQFRVEARRGEYLLNYLETLQEKQGQTRLIIDLDGYTLNVEPEKCLQVTDALHDVIGKEFEETIREPVYEYMRNANGE